jgi:predicted nucleic acid-binding protein
MGHYLDTSVIVSMIVNDVNTMKAAAWFDRTEPTPLVSVFAKAEFSATISRHVRSHRLSAAEGRTTLDIFDKWLDGDARLVNVSNDDIKMADLMVRDFDTKLLAPDAIHLAVAKRLGATLITFDARLAAAASLQNIAIEIPA